MSINYEHLNALLERIRDKMNRSVLWRTKDEEAMCEWEERLQSHSLRYSVDPADSDCESLYFVFQSVEDRAAALMLK